MLAKISTKYLLYGILILASILRFANLGKPQSYIFDEVYHAFTAKEYLSHNIAAWEWWTTPPEGVAYEWTHPPIAKYGMVLGMTIFGVDEFGYRSFSALFGVLSILGMYLLVKKLTKIPRVALFTAFIVSIEGTHIAQSRIAMNDIYMLNFYIWALVAAASNKWKVASILYGLALGSKWSALYGILPLGLIYLNQNYKILSSSLKNFCQSLLNPLRYTLIAIATYVLSFTPFITIGHNWQQWWELHRQMWYYHTHLVATHGYQSTPLQWIFAARPVWYWVEYGQNTISNIYVQGNPAILWLGLVAIIIQLPKIKQFYYLLFYVLYTVLFVPWVFSPRIMFYYHYLPSSVFLAPILATWINYLPKYWRFIIIIIFIIGILLIAPMLYGISLPSSYWQSLFTIFPTWK